MKQLLNLKVNGDEYELYVDSMQTLQEVLREELGLTGTKKGCDTGYCGACTVLVDNQAVKSCLIIALQVQGREITTIEGLIKNNTLDVLQQAFIDGFGVQCGFCTPGMIMSAKALLMENSNPSEDEIKEAITGNLCRCTGYKKIVESIQLAADKL